MVWESWITTLYPIHILYVGYQGWMCEQKINPCASSPCHNNGTCYSDEQSFSCSCAPGFTGPTCARLVDFCALNPCAHGICRSVGTSYRCLCVPGTHFVQSVCVCVSVPSCNIWHSLEYANEGIKKIMNRQLSSSPVLISLNLKSKMTMSIYKNDKNLQSSLSMVWSVVSGEQIGQLPLLIFDPLLFFLTFPWRVLRMFFPPLQSGCHGDATTWCCACRWSRCLQWLYKSTDTLIQKHNTDVQQLFS